MAAMSYAPPPGYESSVVFQVPPGQRVTALLRRLSWHTAAFEVPGAWPPMRLSERLREVKIWAAGTQVYEGPAVVTSLVDAGTGYLGEIKLDPGVVSQLLRDRHNGQPHIVPGNFDSFLREWQRVYCLRPEYKAAVADLYSFLTELRLWLKQGELLNCGPGDEQKQSRILDWLRDVEPRVTAALGELFQRYEAAMARIDPELVAVHYRFGRQQLHSFLLCAPFVRRSFQKPLGYSGDYEVVNMMFRDPFQGETLLGMLINAYALQLPPIVGHRNRIAYLKRVLIEESVRIAGSQALLRVFSLGCGPAHEIQQFLAESELSDRLDAVLADFNSETLDHTRAALESLRQRYHRRASLRLIQQSAQDCILEAERKVQTGRSAQYDLVYCAGLFDYLSDRLCRRLLGVLYNQLKPGGLLIATNVDHHGARYEMECFLDWHLVYRNTADMAALVPAECPLDAVAVRRESAGVNVFLEIRKPAA
jgi:extracellular factor (EF) 3-hydroxypalmitic acid methyl ester biosynthesis protein